MIRTVIFCFFALLSSCHVLGQDFHFQYNDAPLDSVLRLLHQQRGVQLSYAPEVVSDCKVSLNGVYPTVEEALAALTQPCGLQLKELNGVFILYRDREAPPASPEQRWINVTVMDQEDGEALPFSSIQFNGAGKLSDRNGRLVYRSQDSSTRVLVSHLGYESIDTVLYGSGSCQFKLKPLTTQLLAVEINSGASKGLQEALYRSEPHVIKLNHQVATFQPGSSDNTLFNVLRLQPGVLAAGEQTKDFLIQGGYQGQSQIVFDGITLFDLSSYNDHIGAVNPLVVKDIEVHKSGFAVDKGDRMAGWVNITGAEGNKGRLKANLRLNNQTLAGLVSVPVHKGAALQMAFRRTYYQLYEPLNLDFLYSDILYHRFTDINLKYSARLPKGNSLDLSFIGFSDDNKLSYDETGSEKEYQSFRLSENRQLGASLRYGKTWARAGITNLTMAFSDLEAQIDNSWVFEDRRFDKTYTRKASAFNAVNERSIKLDHAFPTGKWQSLKMGLSWVQNNTLDSQSTLKVPTNERSLNRITGYIKDDISLSPKWNLSPGVRWDYLSQVRQWFFQPRISSHWEAFPGLRFGAAWGVYRQYLSRDVFIDALGNFNFNWVLFQDSEGMPPLSLHQVLSVQYQKRSFTLELEAFKKDLDNLSRWKTNPRTSEFLQFSGIGQAYGIEATFKRKTEKLETWMTYTWSKAEEQFRAAAPEGLYVRAPQDQRHELKAAGILETGAFVWSVNYVYGSGFQISNPRWSDRAYSRLDAALLYRTQGKRLRCETGLSVLNVLNRKNVRPSYLTFFVDESTSVQLGTPITPSVFLNIGF